MKRIECFVRTSSIFTITNKIIRKFVPFSVPGFGNEGRNWKRKEDDVSLKKKECLARKLNSIFSRSRDAFRGES